MKKLDIFVSSRTHELHNERMELKEILANLDFNTFIFEENAGARTESSVDVFTEEVSNCHIYVGIFREEYSEATEKEYRIALANKKEILIYVSDYNITDRHQNLENLLKELKQNHTIQHFDNSRDLGKKVRKDITDVLVRSFLNQKEGRFSSVPTLNDQVILKHYIQKITTENPNTLQNINPVASEIMSVWYKMGYTIQDCVFDNDVADFQAIVSHWSGTNKVFVRCVNGEISSNDVNYATRHLAEINATKAFLFAYNRISPSAKELASEKNNVVIQTQAQFYQSILKPEKYFDKLKNEYEKQEIEKYYVPLECYKKSSAEDESQFVDEQLGDIDSYVSRWLSDKSQKHLALLGDFGSGKTWFSRRFAKICLDKYLEDPDNNKLPIFISLRDYAKSYSIQQLITDLLLNEYGFELQGGYETFVELNNQGKFLLIFDGFDEMAQKVDFNVVTENFKELAKVANLKSKVLLTCRTTYFRYEIESHKILGGKMKTSSTLPTTQAGFEIVQLKELSDEQIVEVMAKRIGDDQKAISYWDKLKPVYDIPSLAHKPVLIPMLIDIMQDIVDSSNVDASTIYHIYTDRWLSQAHAEGRTYLRNKWESLFFVIALAWHMLKSQELKIHWKKIPDFINNYYNIDSNELDYYANDLRTNTFLKRDERGFFEFSHKSMTEFFVAYKFAIELGVAKPAYRRDIPVEETNQKSIPELAVSFGAIVLNPEIILFLKEMIGQVKSLKDLFDRCKEGNNENLGYLLSNLITLLVVLKESFDSEDISNANMPSADLQGSVLTKCKFDGGNLSQVIMNNGKFTESSFNNCNMSQSSLIRANFHDIKAENANLTDCNGRLSNFSSSTFTASNLSNSKFQHSKFIGCNLDNIIASSADFGESDLTDSSITNALFDGCNFENSTLTNTTFKNSQLTNCSFYSAETTNVEFTNCNLQNSKLEHLNLSRRKFGSINLVNTSLIGSDLSGSRFLKALMRNCRLSNCNLSTCIFEDVDFTDAALEHSNLNGVTLKNCNLNNAALSGIKVDKINIDQTTKTEKARIDRKTFDNLPKNFQSILARDNEEYSLWLEM